MSKSVFINENKNFSLIIEIQSGIVRGAVSRIENNKISTIVQTLIVPIPRRAKTGSSQLINSMLKSLAEVAFELTNKYHISSSHIILSSPWVISFSKTIKVKYDKETKITKKIIEDIIENGSDKKDFDKDVIYIDKKIFEIKINGYSVTKYDDKSAKELDISFATVMSSENLLSKIRNTLRKGSGISKICFHSGLLLSYMSLRKKVIDMKNYAYIHVHSELTDIIIVKNDLCSYISSFPIGLSNLIREIGHSVKQNEAVANSNLTLFEEGKLYDTEKQKIQLIVDKYMKEWSSHLDLESMPRVFSLVINSHSTVFKNSLKSLIKDEIHFLDFDVDIMNMYNIALNDMI